MIPGNFLQLVFPNLESATHCSINRMAYLLLEKNFPNINLPHWKKINYFEGLRGVDGLWLRSKHITSRSTFNPNNSQGSGIKEVGFQYGQLVKALKNGKSEEIARRSAFVAHVITDVCTPPHQHGKKIPINFQRWFLWKAKNDWQDDASNHAMFEVSSAFRILFKNAKLKLNKKVEFSNLRAGREKKIKLFQKKLINQVVRIEKLGLYHEYKKKGWTRNIEESMTKKLLPEVAVLVASAWYMAMAESKQLARTNLSVTRNKPLIGS
ncbi:MAG: hypothetical protein Q8P90_01375 [bacterium]|nr:hypothetical protein [bacterium]